MKTLTTGMALAMLAGAAQAADCVDAKTAKAGFVLEKAGISSEFRPAPGGMVAVTNKYQSDSPQTQYLYAGLIEVFRDSDTGRLSMIPLGDLKKLFPLKAGAKSKTEFVRLSSKKAPKGTETLALTVKARTATSSATANTMCSWSAKRSPAIPARSSTPSPRSIRRTFKRCWRGATMKEPARRARWGSRRSRRWRSEAGTR